VSSPEPSAATSYEALLALLALVERQEQMLGAQQAVIAEQTARIAELERRLGMDARQSPRPRGRHSSACPWRRRRSRPRSRCRGTSHYRVGHPAGHSLRSPRVSAWTPSSASRPSRGRRAARPRRPAAPLSGMPERSWPSDGDDGMGKEARTWSWQPTSWPGEAFTALRSCDTSAVMVDNTACAPLARHERGP